MQNFLIGCFLGGGLGFLLFFYAYKKGRKDEKLYQKSKNLHLMLEQEKLESRPCLSDDELYDWLRGKK